MGQSVEVFFPTEGPSPQMTLGSVKLQELTRIIPKEAESLVTTAG